MEWRPSQPNGWNPSIQRYGDRLLVVYGSDGVWIAELTLDLQRVSEQQVAGRQAFAVGWMAPGVAAWQQYDLGGDLNRTRLVQANITADWTPVPSAPSLFWGGAAACGQGHVLTYLAAPYFESALDGVLVAAGSGGAPSVAWPFVAHAASNDNNAIKIYRNGVVDEVLGAPAGFNAMKIGPHGHVAYGYPWLLGLGPSGTLTDQAVAPWRSEGPFKILDLDGAPWLVTTSWDSVTARLLLRPWRGDGVPTDRRAWSIPIPVSGGDLIEDGKDVIAAVHDDRGALLVSRVQKQPLTTLAPVVAELPDRWAGYYYAAGRYGDFDPAQNCTMIARSMFADASGVQPGDTDFRFAQAILKAGRVFADPADIPVVVAIWDRVAGIIIGETSGPAETKAIAVKARAAMAAWNVPQRPIVATVMVSQQTDPGWRDAADWLGLECYLDAPGPGNWWDTQPAIARQLDRAADVFGVQPVLLIGQAYDRNGAWTNLDTLEAIQPALVAALRRDYVRGVLWFAYARPGGTKDHPVLEQWHQATVAATRAPAVETITNGGGMSASLTITTAFPIRGTAPFTVRLEGKITEGRFDRFFWGYKKEGSGGSFEKQDDLSTTLENLPDGTYDVYLRGEGPDGPATTGQLRQIIVGAPAPGGGGSGGPISLDDVTDLQNTLEAEYQVQHGASATFIDPVGRALWPSEYIRRRQAGLDHGAALGQVVSAIRVAEGRENPR